MSVSFCCRTCGKRRKLIYAKNLFSKDNQLLHQIEALTGLWLTGERSLPQNICAKCLSNLEQAIEFRDRCIEVNNQLLFGDWNELVFINSAYDSLAKEEVHIKQEKETEKEAEIAAEVEWRASGEISEEAPSSNQNSQFPATPDVESVENSAQKSAASDKFSNSDGENSEQSNLNLTKQNPQLISQRFRKKKKLKRIQTENSKKLDMYFCEQCGRNFHGKNNLGVHMQRHLGIKQFECEQCGYRDYTQHLIRLHKRIRHEGELPYKCKYCENRYANSMKRLRHQRTHVEHVASLAAPLQCKICHKWFSKKESLDKHAIVHTGEQPFCCEICNVRFNRKSSLKTHFRSKAHLNKINPNIAEIVVDSS